MEGCEIELREPRFGKGWVEQVALNRWRAFMHIQRSMTTAVASDQLQNYSSEAHVRQMYPLFFQHIFHDKIETICKDMTTRKILR